MFDSKAISLATRKGREIPNIQDPDLPPHRAEFLTRRLGRDFPEARLRRSPTAQYNCHGLTFANRRTQVGIDDPEIVTLILEDDGYHQIPASGVEPGDIVVCYDGSEVTHSGIVFRVDPGDPSGGVFAQIFVLSKWAHGGEYYHLINTGPYREHSPTYWTEKV